MDASGTIYKDCEKCGMVVEWDRDCPKCGTPSEAAKELSEMFAALVIDEVPDPPNQLREALIKEHQKRQREKPRGR